MTNYATTSGIYDQSAAALQNSTALGQAYDASKTDNSFYSPDAQKRCDSPQVHVPSPSTYVRNGPLTRRCVGGVTAPGCSM